MTDPTKLEELARLTPEYIASWLAKCESTCQCGKIPTCHICDGAYLTRVKFKEDSLKIVAALLARAQQTQWVSVTPETMPPESVLLDVYFVTLTGKHIRWLCERRGKYYEMRPYSHGTVCSLGPEDAKFWRLAPPAPEVEDALC
jgi:hypothetical protein